MIKMGLGYVKSGVGFGNGMEMIEMVKVFVVECLNVYGYVIDVIGVIGGKVIGFDWSWVGFECDFYVVGLWLKLYSVFD